MTHYIDKSAVVAEIEKIINKPAPPHDQQCSWEDGYYGGLYEAESIIDTLEVKEIDLEKEIQSWVEDNSVNGYYREDVYGTAEHFFELGLKAQKE